VSGIAGGVDSLLVPNLVSNNISGEEISDTRPAQ